MRMPQKLMWFWFAIGMSPVALVLAALGWHFMDRVFR